MCGACEIATEIIHFLRTVTSSYGALNIPDYGVWLDCSDNDSVNKI